MNERTKKKGGRERGRKKGKNREGGKEEKERDQKGKYVLNFAVFKVHIYHY